MSPLHYQLKLPHKCPIITLCKLSFHAGWLQLNWQCRHGSPKHHVITVHVCEQLYVDSTTTITCWVVYSSRTWSSVCVFWQWWSPSASTCVCTCWGGRHPLSRSSWCPATIIMRDCCNTNYSLGQGLPTVRGMLLSANWLLGLGQTIVTCCRWYSIGIWP